MLIKHSITVTTITGGTATAYLPKTNGKLLRIRYAKTDYADGVDFTITGEDTGESLWTDTDINASEIVRPRIAVQNEAGDDINYEGVNKICEPYILVDERIKIVIAQGDDAKSGTFHCIIEQ